MGCAQSFKRAKIIIYNEKINYRVNVSIVKDVALLIAATRITCGACVQTGMSTHRTRTTLMGCAQSFKRAKIIIYNEKIDCRVNVSIVKDVTLLIAATRITCGL